MAKEWLLYRPMSDIRLCLPEKIYDLSFSLKYTFRLLMNPCVIQFCFLSKFLLRIIRLFSLTRPKFNKMCDCLFVNLN